jgi:excisionase family DNA binding protein
MTLLTIREVAERLNISLSMAYRLVATGEISSYQIGSCRRVSEEDLDAFLEERRTNTIKIPEPRRRHF